mgnify:CR=1 FL=1
MLLNFSDDKNYQLTTVKLVITALFSCFFLSACTPSSDKPLKRFQHSITGSYAADISNDGKWSVISSIHHGISVWDLEKNALTYQWAQQQNSSDNLVLAIDISNTNSHALTASRENFALWNMQTGKSEGYWQVRESNIRDIAVSNNGDYLLIGKGNGTVVHVTVDTGRRLEFLGHKEKINSVDMMPNGRVAMSGGNDFIAYIWDTQSGQVIYQFNHTSRVSKVALDPLGRFAFSADSMKSAHIWDLKTGKLISTLQGTKRHEVFSSVSFSPDGKTVVYRKISGGYITQPNWDLNTGIYAVSAKGERKAQKPLLITENGQQPHFGKSNNNIYVIREGESPQLAFVSLDGKEDRTLYQGKFATEYRVSPTGEYLAFAERFKVFVTPFIERGDVIDIGPKGGNLPVKQLSVRAGEGINWHGDSSQLYWNLGADLYQASVKGLFAITPKDDASLKDKKEQAGNDNENDNVTQTYLGYSSKIDKPSGNVAFVGGKVITMEGEQIIDNGVVLVEGNVIKAIGSVDDVNIPESTKVINIAGKSIIPGLIDAHAHGPQGNSQIIPQQNWKNYAGLALGVTSIHDPSNDTNEFFAASEMQKAGKIVAARLFSTGKILYGANAAGYTAHVDNLEDAKFHVERLKKAGAFSVKSYNQPRRNQRQQFIQAARELEMLVVPEGGSLLQHNLTMVVDGHTTLEHSIPVASVYEDVKQLWSQSTMAYTPTLVVAYGGIWGENYWYDTTDVWLHPRLSKYVPSEFLAPRAMRRPKAPMHHYNHISVAKVAKELQDIGIKVNAGGHGQREGLAMHWEMWMMAQGGMTPLEAIKTATISPAQTLGLDDQLGSIKVGKLADLIVIDGDVSKDIRVSDKVVYTMINGRLYNAETMNEIGNYDNARKKFYFESK